MIFLLIAVVWVALWFNSAQSHLDRQIAEDSRREEALQSHIGRMEYLVLEQDLRNAGLDSEASILARRLPPQRCASWTAGARGQCCCSWWKPPWGKM